MVRSGNGPGRSPLASTGPTSSSSPESSGSDWKACCTTTRSRNRLVALVHNPLIRAVVGQAVGGLDPRRPRSRAWLRLPDAPATAEAAEERRDARERADVDENPRKCVLRAADRSDVGPSQHDGAIWRGRDQHQVVMPRRASSSTNANGLIR